jgi:HD-like signal output (HDOD) protein
MTEAPEGSKTRILFVDDDANILASLRRMFHAERDTWEMTFAEGPKEALPLVERNSYDIVVSDMRMPDMDGAQLLAHVRERHPASVRLILSGNTSRAAALRAASIAHQFLNKPLEPEVLKQAVLRASNIESRLSHETIRSVLGRHNSLPSPSSTLRLLNDELGDANCDLGRVARIIEGDLAITTKVLGLVNSAFFALPREVSNVKDAVVYLGIENVRALAATADVFRAFAGSDELNSLAAGLQVHSHGVLDVARAVHPLSESRADLYLGAVMHDLGFLAIAALLPDSWSALRARHGNRWGLPDEKETVGATHCEIGAYLLALWGLPYGAVEIVAMHHDTLPLAGGCSTNVEAVRLAEALLSETDPSPGHNPERESAYLESLGIDDQLSTWRRQRDITLQA